MAVCVTQSHPVSLRVSHARGITNLLAVSEYHFRSGCVRDSGKQFISVIFCFVKGIAKIVLILVP